MTETSNLSTFNFFPMSYSPVQAVDSLIKQIEKEIDGADFSPDRVSSGTVVYLGDGIAKAV